MTTEKSPGHLVYKYVDTEYLVTSASSDYCAQNEADMKIFVILSLVALATALNFTEEWNEWKQVRRFV